MITHTAPPITRTAPKDSISKQPIWQKRLLYFLDCLCLGSRALENIYKE